MSLIPGNGQVADVIGMEVFPASSQGAYRRCHVMWQDEEFDIVGGCKVVKGPGLQRISASCMAYNGGDLYPLTFYTMEPVPTDAEKKSTRATVSSTDHSGKGNVMDLRLSPYFGRNWREYRIYDYNFVKGKGDLVVLERKGPKDSKHSLTMKKMLELSDAEFIMVYVLQMTHYRWLPVECSEKDCNSVIKHPLDLRRVAGGSYCPICFAKMPLNSFNKLTQKFWERAANLLPDKPFNASSS